MMNGCLQKLEKQVSLLDSSPSNVGLIYTGFCEVDASSKRVIGRMIPEKRGYVFEEIVGEIGSETAPPSHRGGLF